MAGSINSSPVHGERDLRGQTVVVIGGSSGIGLDTARLARASGADIILTARNPDRLHRGRPPPTSAGSDGSSTRCRSAASSARPTSPHWPSTS